jgi:hypothetical protein
MNWQVAGSVTRFFSQQCVLVFFEYTDLGLSKDR